MMKTINWRLVEVLAAALDESEREAVLGDFAESGESGWARLEIFGLGGVARGSSVVELAALNVPGRCWSFGLAC